MMEGIGCHAGVFSNAYDLAELGETWLRGGTLKGVELVPSDVTHYDLRWEFYPSASELLSVGVFYKLIDRPIELTVQSGVEQRLSYANAAEAENFGVEFEGRKTLGDVGRWFDRADTIPLANLSPPSKTREARST